MNSVQQIGQRLEELVSGGAEASHAAELLQLGEEILQHWVIARGMEPTFDKREGFRLLALHRQGSQDEPSFNACRETCRELVYHYNLLLMQSTQSAEGSAGTIQATSAPDKTALMMALVANHLYLFVSGKMESRQLGDFCCSSRPIRSDEQQVEMGKLSINISH